MCLRGRPDELEPLPLPPVRDDEPVRGVAVLLLLLPRRADEADELEKPAAGVADLRGGTSLAEARLGVR